MSEKILEPKVNETKELLNTFCNQKINTEYADLTVKLLFKIVEKEASYFSQKEAKNWAAAIIQTIGKINFLSDNSFEPYVSINDLNVYFDCQIKETELLSKEIRDWFQLDDVANFEFTTATIKSIHPVYNSVMVDGLMVPIDLIPESYQEEVRAAREKGEDIQFWTEKDKNLS